MKLYEIGDAYHRVQELAIEGERVNGPHGRPHG